jgi:hypothetical protein
VISVELWKDGFFDGLPIVSGSRGACIIYGDSDWGRHEIHTVMTGAALALRELAVLLAGLAIASPCFWTLLWPMRAKTG